MTEREQTEAFAHDLDKLVDRYRQEFEMSYAAVCGTLQMKSWLLFCEAHDGSNETEDE